MSPADTAAVRSEVRALRAAGRRALAVLDDDPTGSQAVRGVDVVLALDDAEIAPALHGASPTAFLLTNSRSLPEEEAEALAGRVADSVHRLTAGRPVDLVTRGDSTLRGHVIAEPRALDAARRRDVGEGYDAVLFAPAFFEAGRTTAGDVHYALLGGERVPAGETEFARDRTFGYRASDLRDFLAERSGGAVGDVASIPLETIREGGPDAVAELLSGIGGGRFVVVNGERDEDYDVVALAANRALAAGKALQFRAGPSFVRALAGIEPGIPLTAEQLAGIRRPGRGLVIVGSHVRQTTRQLERLRALGGLRELALDVATVLGDGGEAHLDRLAGEVVAALGESDVVLATTRTVVAGDDPQASLEIARRVSAAVVRIVEAALAATPAWVVAKGGITSHDVAAHGLGIRRAEVVGQFGRGIISLLVPRSARPEAIGVPYVVFAGNVGDDAALAGVVSALRG